MSTIAQQLAHSLVKEIIARKQQQHIAPALATAVEISKSLSSAFAALVADGSLTLHSTLNNIAYALPQTPAPQG